VTAAVFFTCYSVVFVLLGNFDDVAKAFFGGATLGEMSWISDFHLMFPEIGYFSTRDASMSPFGLRLLGAFSPLALFGIPGLFFLAVRQTYRTGVERRFVWFILATELIGFVFLNQVILNFKVLNTYSIQIVFHSFLAFAGALAVATLILKCEFMARPVPGKVPGPATLASRIAALPGRARSTFLVAAIGLLSFAASLFIFAAYKNVFWGVLYVRDAKPGWNVYRAITSSEIEDRFAFAASRLTRPAMDIYRDARRIIAEQTGGRPVRLLLVNPVSIYHTATLSTDLRQMVAGPTEFSDNTLYEFMLFGKTHDVRLLHRNRVDYVVVAEEAPNVASAGRYSSLADFIRDRDEQIVALTQLFGPPVRTGNLALFKAPAADAGETAVPQPTAVFVGGNTSVLDARIAGRRRILLAHNPAHRQEAAFRSPDTVILGDGDLSGYAAWLLSEQYGLPMRRYLNVPIYEGARRANIKSPLFPQTLFLDIVDYAQHQTAVSFTRPTGYVPTNTTFDWALTLPAGPERDYVLLMYASVPTRACGGGAIDVEQSPDRSVVVPAEDHVYRWHALYLTRPEDGGPIRLRLSQSGNGESFPPCALYVNEMVLAPKAAYDETMARLSAIPADRIIRIGRPAPLIHPERAASAGRK
jgi:hypothetical protein